MSMPTLTRHRIDVAEPFDRDGNGKPIVPLGPAALYGFASLIRASETALLDLFGRGLLSGTTHTCIGQELCQMAAVRCLDDRDDVMFSNHRNHGHFLTHSGDFLGLIAEIMGRELGVCGGHGGSQHLVTRGFYSSGVQGGLTAAAVGCAFRQKLAGSNGVTAVFLGDGTFGEGLVYESLNVAALWRVPVLFVVENNGIAQTTPTAPMFGGLAIAARGEAFGLPTWTVDDANPLLFEIAADAVDAVRTQKSAGMLVINTARLGPHSKGDDLRDTSEMNEIRRRDPLTRLGAQLDAIETQRIDRANREFLDAILEAASSAKEPKYSRRPIHAFETLSGRPLAAEETHVTPHRNVRSCLNAELRQLLAEDARVVLLGEDLHDPNGGAFKVTSGLSTEFAGRVISTPISEAAIVGAGIGLALTGYRPIVEVMFADFLSLAADQILNQAVKLAQVPGESVPLVIRTSSGGRRGYGPTHSQSPESIFAAFPGLTVVAVSHRHNPGALLRRAVLHWPYPTIVFEPKLLYGMTSEPGPYQPCAADAADPAADLFPTLVSGDAGADITLVTYGGMLPTVETAARALEAEELSVRIVVPSLLAPFPRHTLLPVLTTGCERIVVVEEAPSAYGVAAELGAVLLESGYRGRFARVGTPPVPIPAARSLESDLIPDARRIADAVIALIDR